jgi:sigma-B regulation protein RsbU (phosphoserine phosphatase)
MLKQVSIGNLTQIRSWLGVPLIYKDRVLGVLTLDKNEPNAFIDADARYVFTLAYQTAIAVENTQLFEEWEEQSTRLKLINEVTQEINTLLDVDQLFEALAKAIYERLDYDQVAILQADETRSLVTLKAAYGEYLSSLEVGVYQQDINEGIIGETIQLRQSILINDVSESNKKLLIDGLKPRSALTVPLFVATQVEAVINVERNYLNGFNDQDLWTLNSLANHAATTIRNAWLYRSLDAYSDRLERTIIARTQRLQAIKKMSQVVSQGLNIDELLTVVGQGIGQIFTLEEFDKIQVTIGLVDG